MSPLYSHATPGSAYANNVHRNDYQDFAAIEVLASRSDRWWLMIECGDVDWAEHSKNIDNSIGAVLSGAEAFAAVVPWIEQCGGWDETPLIVTADHRHYFSLDRPEAFVQTTTE